MVEAGHCAPRALMMLTVWTPSLVVVDKGLKAVTFVRSQEIAHCL